MMEIKIFTTNKKSGFSFEGRKQELRDYFTKLKRSNPSNTSFKEVLRKEVKN